MIPFASREQIAELDALLVEKFNIPLDKIMDTAGLRVAEFVREHFRFAHHILVFCGRGNNGGDGIAAARYLQEFGYEPKIILIEGELKPLVVKQLELADEYQIPILTLEEYREHIMIDKYDIVIDSLIGHGLNGPPRGEVEQAILAINEAHLYNIPILSIDVPSGMDSDEGPIYEPHTQATHTISMALPRKGLGTQGEVFVADIGVPQEAYKLIDIPEKEYFSEAKILPVIY
jgi:hydroxyethylthiazole kinase-like uncharacterized protein yjeF